MNSDFALSLHVLGFLTACKGRPASSEILAKTYGTSPVVVRRLVAKLKLAGLVRTSRGAMGGSVLARSSSEINLRQVFEAVSGGVDILRRPPRDEGVVSQVIGDVIEALFQDAEEALLERLEAVTIAAMDTEVGPKICNLLSRRIVEIPEI